MSSAKVKFKEIDLSTRVPSFPGVYGGIVIQAKKGPVNEPYLTTSDTALLSIFTPDEEVAVGYDLAYFSALSFLEKSDSLWVVRAAKDAYYSGASVKEAGASTDNQAFPDGQNLDDPLSYVFDSNPDIPGVAEVTKVTCVADVAGSLDGTYFIMSDDAGTVAFWFDHGDSGTPEPAHGADRAVEITTVTADDDADTVAGFVQAAIDADSKFGATVSGPDVTVTDASTGDRTDAVAGTSGFTMLVTTQGVDEVDLVDEIFIIYASNQGVWGDKVGFKIITDPDTVKEPNAFIIEVYREDNQSIPIESYTVSRVEGHKDGFGRNIYIEDVLESSNYIRVRDNAAVDESTLPKEQSTILFLNADDDGLAVTDAEMITAAQTMSNPDDLPLTVLMDGGFATPAYGQELENICNLETGRGDCVAILSVPFSDEASSTYLADIIDYRKTELNLNSSFAALYTPHVKIYDRFNDRAIFIAPDGFAGAAISFSAANYEVWFPPAGFKRGNFTALDLRRRFTTAEMDSLQAEGINPLRFVPGRGLVVWGQKTLLSRPSALDRLNVRLLLIAIEPGIEEALEDFLFDLNDEATRSIVTAILESFLGDIQARRGLQDYNVICDSTNNSATDIDEGRLNVDIYIKPIRSVELIPVRMIITATGLSFEQAAQLV